MPIDLKVSRHPSRSSSADISPMGLSFIWNKKLAKGLPIRIALPVKEKRFWLAGKIVYSSGNPKTGVYKTGVRFEDPSSAFHAKLAEEILEILEYQKKISKTVGHFVSEEEAAFRWVSKYAKYFSGAKLSKHL